MTRRCRKFIRLGLLSLLVLSLSVRVMVPAGFMPASLASGGPYVICPKGLPNFAAVVSQGAGQSEKDGHEHGHENGHALHGKHHSAQGNVAPVDHSNHEEALSHSDPGVQFCPVGSVFSAVAVPAVEALLLLAWIPASYLRTESRPTWYSQSPNLYFARGPPRNPSFLT